MASRPLPVSKLRIQRRKRRIAVALLVLLSLFIVAGAAVGLTWLPWLRIQAIEITGASSVNIANAKEIVRQRINDQYFFVIQRDNILLFPRDEVAGILMRKYPVIEKVDITPTGPMALKVTILERHITALWCGESPASSSSCYLLDENGVAYAPAAHFSGEVYIKFYGPIAGGTVRQFVTPQKFRDVSIFVNALRDKTPNNPPVMAVLENDDVRVGFESGFTLIYSTKDDGADVLERFSLALLQAEPFTQHKLSDFEYLDLRFGDKLYYKLK